MKRTIYWLMSAILMLSMLLSACGPQAAPEVQEPAPEGQEAAPAEPAEEQAEMAPVDFDAAFDTFLADMQAYNTITSQALNEMLAEEPPPFILDARTVGEVEEKGHIPGAVLIPLNELAKKLEYLPSFDTTIVSYCGSGWRCTIALTALEALGWEDVLCLKGGSFAGWVEAGYEVATGMPEAEPLNAAQPDPAAVAAIDAVLSNMPDGFGGITAEALNTALAENPDLFLIDVRRDEEVQSKGTIEGAIHIPLESLVERKAEWPAETDAPIVVYCGSGHRSTIAMTILWTYGYSDVRSLKGGFSAWAAEGYPVVGGEAALDAAYATFLADMEVYNTISLEALNELLAEEPPPFLLDVRNVAEVEEKGYIEGAVLIPLRELAQNLEYLPSFDTPIVSYCGSGWRCTIALTALEALGWEDVRCLKGGSFSGWVEAGYPIATGVPEAEPLNAAAPDPAMVSVIDQALPSIPEGWGVIAAEVLNAELAENPDMILIDVRRDDELQENGAIEGALHIPLESFIERKAEWPAKDAKIVVYCGSGHRSTIAMTMLWSYGYTDVRSLKGGFGAWVEAGYPVAEVVMP